MTAVKGYCWGQASGTLRADSCSLSSEPPLRTLLLASSSETQFITTRFWVPGTLNFLRHPYPPGFRGIGEKLGGPRGPVRTQ